MYCVTIRFLSFIVKATILSHLFVAPWTTVWTESFKNWRYWMRQQSAPGGAGAVVCLLEVAATDKTSPRGNPIRIRLSTIARNSQHPFPNQLFVSWEMVEWNPTSFLFLYLTWWNAAAHHFPQYSWMPVIFCNHHKHNLVAQKLLYKIPEQ